jgi:GntR family transcriptional regulator, transcriptional repressor for pyruvate dehydrogenase complex
VAFLAAQRATDAEIKGLLAVVDQRDAEAAAGGEPRRFDLEFHRLLADAARNPVHAAISHALMALEAEVVAPQVSLSDAASAEINAAHRRIIEAMAARKAGEARAIMAAHIEEVQASLDRSAASA